MIRFLLWSFLALTGISLTACSMKLVSPLTGLALGIAVGQCLTAIRDVLRSKVNGS